MEQKKHLYIPTRGDGRFTFCPRCGNTVFSEDAEYCRMCGFYLYNDCSNQGGGFGPSDCGHRYNGDARYCEHCGAPTTLFRRGVLLAWDELVSEHGSVDPGIDRGSEAKTDPSGEADLDPDDIPF